ncbi:MAG: CDP-alcohol phosphatidyltransferase family protein [Planctomycetota bacterium]
MLDRVARRIVDPLLEPPAAWLVRRGVSASTVTVAGFVAGIAACGALAYREYHWALLLIVANRVADGLDGAVARRTTASDWGGYLDSVCDTIFYAAVPLGFAVGAPEHWLPAFCLAHSFSGTGGSFLTFAIMLAKRGSAGLASTTADSASKTVAVAASTTARVTTGAKSFPYHRGLMEGTETIAFFLAFCLAPSWFALLAWTFTALCWLTTATRVAMAWYAFNELPHLPRGTGGDGLGSPSYPENQEPTKS